MEVSDVFLEARDLIGERGWARAIRENSAGQLCLRGAVGKAALRTGLSYMDGLSTKALNDYCWLTYDRGAMSVNDSLLRSKDQAWAVMDDAARWAKEAGI